MLTLEEAKRKVGQVAMGDLYGMSEPPEGVPDNYPYNAARWRDSFPSEWRDELEDVICYVYRNEAMPVLAVKGKTTAKYNHTLTVCYSVISLHRDMPTREEALAGLLKRVAAVLVADAREQEKVLFAKPLFNTFEVEED